MESTLMNSPLNDTQIFVLQTFARAKSEEEKNEITAVYLDYIQKKLDAATDKWWEENNMTTEKFEEMCSNLHYRTTHK